MPKLTSEEKFIDLSDYGRPIAVAAAAMLKNTPATPVQVTLMFGVSGLIAAICIINGFYITAGIFLILKSIIDAVDGELARIKERPSYTGRYLDSIFDFFLNLIIILAIWRVDTNPVWAALLAFFCIQLQGTLYNYYYVILRHFSTKGDRTSKIFETSAPDAYPQESQQSVNLLFNIYKLCYASFDKLIYAIDRNAPQAVPYPKWFMSLLSLYGLGFQLLIIAVCLALGYINLIIPFFILYTSLLFVLIFIRRFFLTENSGRQPIYRD